MNFKNKIIKTMSYPALESKRIRSFVNQVDSYANGFNHASYDINDEAVIALSFITDDRKGGGVVVDGGANTGSWSKAVLDYGSNLISSVLMIEPDESHAKNHNEILNKYPGLIDTEWVALGSKNERMQLFYDKESSTLASLYDRHIGHHNVSLLHKKEVNVCTLFDILKRRKINKIDFLKLDLEGHELAALEGSRNLLDNGLISVIQFEFGGANIDSKTYFRDFWELLHDVYGYKMYRIIPGRRLLRLDKYSEQHERFTWQNIIACLPEKQPQLKVINE